MMWWQTLRLALRKLGLVVFLAGGAAGVAWADEGTPDFSAAFAKLREFGLPDVTGATGYVELEAYPLSGGTPMSQRYSQVLQGGPELGNRAWLFEAQGKAIPFVKVNGTRGLLVTDGSAVDEQAAAGEVAGPLYMRQQIRDKPVTEDAEQLLAHLERKRAEMARENMGAEGMGPVLLFAAQLDALGHRDLANRLAFQALGIVPDANGVVADALDEIARQRYGALLQDFSRTGNWTALADGLDALADRMGATWYGTEGVRQQSERARRRAGSRAPPPLADSGFSAEERKMAAALAGVTAEDLRQLMRHRFMPGGGEDSDGDGGILTRLRERGMESVPLLTALLDDGYPIAVTQAQLASGGMGGQLLAMGSRSDRELPDRVASRRDVALVLLGDLVPLDQEAHSQLARAIYSNQGSAYELMKHEARKWYERARRQSPAERALDRLGGADPEQISKAIGFIVESGDEALMDRVEAKLLEEPERTLSAAQAYVAMRGAQAAGFVDRLEAAMKDRMGATTFAERNMAMYVSMLRVHTSSLGVDTALDRMAAQEGNLQEAGMTLARSVTRHPPSELEAKLLAKAAAAENPTGTVMLLRYLPFLLPEAGASWREHMGVKSPEVKAWEEKWKDWKPDVAGQAEVWQRLLEDTRPVVALNAWDDAHDTVADVAAGYLLMCAVPSCGSSLAGVKMAGPVGAAWLRQTARDVLERARAGRELPSPEELAKPLELLADRRDALVAEAVAQADPAQLRAWLAERTPAELIALAAVADNEALFKVLAGPSHRLAAVEPFRPGDAVPESLRQLEGRTLDEALLRGIIEGLKKDDGKGEVAVISLVRQPAGQGMQMRYRAAAPNEASQPDNAFFHPLLQGFHGGPMAANGGVIVTLSSPTGGGNAMWPRPAKAADDGDKLQRDVPDEDFMTQMREEYWKNFNAALGERVNPFQPLTILVVAYPPEGAATQQPPTESTP